MAKKLEELSLSQLKEQAKEMGIEELDSFTSKKPLIATIRAVRKTIEANKPKIDPTKDATDALETPKERKEIEDRHLAKADRMRKHLEAQPKVRFMIPLEGEEKPGVVKKVMVNGREETVPVSGAVHSFTLNGYKINIPKGVFVDVAEQVADYLSQSWKLAQEAGKQWDVNRTDPKTGQPIKSQL